MAAFALPSPLGPFFLSQLVLSLALEPGFIPVTISWPVPETLPNPDICPALVPFLSYD